MEDSLLLSIPLLLVQLLLLWFLASLLKRWSPLKYSNRAPLPPGPFPLPIIGNLLHLGKEPHRSLAQMAKRYGPLVSLQLGCRTTIVISSPSVAKEMFRKHDSVLANRSVSHSATGFDFHLNSLAVMPADQHWRNMRRIWKAEVVSTVRINTREEQRRRKVDQLDSYLKQCSDVKAPVNIGKAVAINSVNLLSNMIFSMDMANYTGPETDGNKFIEIIRELLEEICHPNISDFFPALKSFDLQGCHHRAEILVRKMVNIFDEIIQHRVQLKSLEVDPHVVEHRDVLDSLLRINKEGNINNSATKLINIPQFILEIFLAGIELTTRTIEWAIVEMVRHPEKMKKAQEEINHVVGQGNLIDETTLMKLPYLQAIIKETMRLYPAAPFLIPRIANADVELCGFMIPKNAQVLVNVWAIGRDECAWENANSFMPERFLGSSIEPKGRDFELIPFGAGRRMCVGAPLAFRILPLVLGMLIHRFDWKMQDGLAPNEIDMEIKIGLTLQKVKPVCLIPCYRG